MARSTIAFMVLVSLWSLVASQETVRVDFQKGTVEGFTLDVLGKKVDTFLGVPFAEPPVGDLRFKAPTPKAAWADVREAKAFGSSCSQMAGMPGQQQVVDGQEDCLFLNVWAPSPRQADTPVLVWIHGGGYSMGTASSNNTDGKIMAAETGLIVVSMNYRLGALGFLALEADEAPGNMGMLDQALALQWVKDNIAVVSGNPDQVTIFGQSNGASDVGMHMLSPTSRGLFTRGVLEGGSALARWDYGTFEGGVGFANVLAESLSCDVNDAGEKLSAADVVACLRGVAVADILQNQDVPAGDLNTPWKPVIDGSFLTADPMVSVSKGDIKDCEVLIGSNKNEAAFFVMRADGFSPDGMTKAQFLSSVKFLFPDANTFGVDAIVFQYTPWGEANDGAGAGLRDATVMTLTDVIFKCPATDFARGCADNGQAVYFYQFAEMPSNTPPGNEWMGVVHGAENDYVFGRPLDPTGPDYTDEEVELSRRIMTYWANFAKTGNPNKGATGDPDGPWPMYTADERKYLVLDASIVNDTYTILSGPDSTKCAFWKTYYPTLQTKTGDLDEAESNWKNQFAAWNTKIANWDDEFRKYQEGKQCDV